MNPGLFAWVLLAWILLLAAAIFLTARNRRRRERFFRSFGSDPALAPGVAADYQPATRYRPASFTLSIPTSSGASFELSRERLEESLLKSIGLAVEVQTGDPGFDEKYYINSDQPELAGACLASPEARSAADQLFGLGCTSVVLDAGILSAAWSPPRKENPEDPAPYREAARHLARLGQMMPASAPPMPEYPLTQRTFLGVVGGASTFGACLTLVCLEFHRFLPGRPLDGWEMFWASLQWSGPTAAMFLLLGAVWISRTSWAGRGLGALALACVFTVPPAGYLAFMQVNSRLDPAEPSAHTLLVEGKHRSSGRRSTRSIWVKSWRPGHWSESLEVGYDDYQRTVEKASRATFVTKPGRLGFEWIVSWRLER